MARQGRGGGGGGGGRGRGHGRGGQGRPQQWKGKRGGRPFHPHRREPAQGREGFDADAPDPGAPRPERRAGSVPGDMSWAGPAPVLPPPEADPPGASPTETYRGLKLHRFQQTALDALRRGSSVLVAAPTGAGKTLVADFAIERALAAGARIAYTAPVKALSNQKYRDFRAILGDRVGIMTGDVTINPGAPLLIMTTEVFRNTIFEDPKKLDDMVSVIFDEVHYIDDRERGTVWEESIIFAPPHIRVVGLSATIPNIEELADWMRSVRPHPVEVVVRERRPVPLRHFLFHPDHGPVSLRELKHRSRGRPRHRDFGRGGGRKFAMRTDRRLLDFIEREDLLPALWFSFNRKECESRAEENRARNLLTPPEREKLLAAYDDLAARYQLESTPIADSLRRLAAHGVLYHHAGLLPVHKEIVERLFTTGLVKLLFATETFALGVNMPARTVCFSSLKKFDGVRLDWLLAREYGQMAGRAGRQGIDETGFVFSRIDERDSDFGALEHLFDGPLEPVRSRFDLDYATLLGHYGRVGEKVVEAYERSLARFQRERRGKGGDGRPAREAETLKRRLEVMRRTGYVADGALTPKGRFAAAVQGFEVHAAEFLDDGLLHACDPVQLVLLFVAVVFEERRGDSSERAEAAGIDSVRRRAEHRVALFRKAEYEARLEDLVKEPDWGMGGPALRFARGCKWEELEQATTISDGDLVRCFRQAIQVLRNIKDALHHVGAEDLEPRMAEAIRLINREVVDARRQLELG